MRPTRRRVLQWASAIAAPTLLLPRRASAAPSALAGNTGGAIFFVLNGGARTQCVFNGQATTGVNPFGALTTGLRVPISAVLQGTGLDTPALNQHLNLVATAQHHNRTGNHDTGRIVACTGWQPQEQKAGALTVLNYAFATRSIPCVNIGNDTPTTVIGAEISSTFAPIKISSPLNVDDLKKSLVDTRVSPAELQRLDALRFALQDRYLRETRYPDPRDIPFFQRKAGDVAQQFNAAALDIRANASLGRYADGTDVGNAGLRTTFGVTATGGGSAMGARAMLALRLRQLGCAGITLSSDNWDLHSGELDVLPAKAADVGKAIGGLVDHMSRIVDPISGKTLLQTTVITVMTDFNRGNWSVATGFNGNDGSDHSTNEDKTCFQCIPIIGGGLPGGRVLGEVQTNGSPATGSKQYETRQVIATVLDLLGVPSEHFLPPTVEPLTAELTA
ncbi:MAG: DUF1501 domain-containing protein [Archangiaceae bacterium]|nr:DUF1501 domain-containing protein [Archangiaceae bacterium]